MALTITVTLEPARAAARIDLAGLTGATYTIARTAPSGNVAGVRGHVGAPVPSAEVVARDYEVPLNLDVVYTATAYDGAGAVLEAVTAPAFRVDWLLCESWLCDLARPTNSLPLVIGSLDALTFAFASGVHLVLDRRAPVLTTLPAYTPTGELVLMTDTLAERDLVRAILGNGYPVLLRTSPDMGIGNLYLGLSSFAEERFLTLGDRPERRFRIQVVQVERPSPSLYSPLAPNTYQNVADTYATYAEPARRRSAPMTSSPTRGRTARSRTRSRRGCRTTSDAHGQSPVPGGAQTDASGQRRRCCLPARRSGDADRGQRDRRHAHDRP